jgi:methionyl-tRNA synthetase
MITIEEFKKIVLQVARITEVSNHPQADRLYIVKVDIDGQIRQLVAGIKTSYQPEELLGKEVVVVSNLEPAIIRGVESQGMLLAAEDEQGISIISLDREVKTGSQVK